MKILVIEDHLELAANIILYLQNEGNIVSTANSYREAIDLLVVNEYDIVVSDIVLEDGSGYDIVKEVKKLDASAGIILISVKDDLKDKLEGFGLGADDYLPKPFHLPELNARIKALYRRKFQNGSSAIQFNEIEIDTESKEVSVLSNRLFLTRKELELLVFFINNKNRVLSKQAIASHLWGDYTDHFSNLDFVYQHIKNLRKKIIDKGGRDYISTVYGLGYKFVDS